MKIFITTAIIWAVGTFVGLFCLEVWKGRQIALRKEVRSYDFNSDELRNIICLWPLALPFLFCGVVFFEVIIKYTVEGLEKLQEKIQALGARTVRQPKTKAKIKTPKAVPDTNYRTAPSNTCEKCGSLVVC